MYPENNGAEACFLYIINMLKPVQYTLLDILQTMFIKMHLIEWNVLCFDFPGGYGWAQLIMIHRDPKRPYAPWVNDDTEVI